MTHVSKRARPDALTCQPPSLRPYDFKGPQLSTRIPPTPPAALRSAFGLPPPEPLRTPAAQGDRCCRERGVAHGDTAELLRRAHHIGIKLSADRGVYGLGGPEPRAPGERARLCL